MSAPFTPEPQHMTHLIHPYYVATKTPRNLDSSTGISEFDVSPRESITYAIQRHPDAAANDSAILFTHGIHGCDDDFEELHRGTASSFCCSVCFLRWLLCKDSSIPSVETCSRTLRLGRRLVGRQSADLRRSWSEDRSRASNFG